MFSNITPIGVLDEIELLMTILFLFNYCLIAYNRYKQLYDIISYSEERRRNNGHILAMVASMVSLLIVDSLRLVLVLERPELATAYIVKVSFIATEWLLSLLFTIIIVSYIVYYIKSKQGRYSEKELIKNTDKQFTRLQIAGFVSLLEIGITCARILIA